MVKRRLSVASSASSSQQKRKNRLCIRSHEPKKYRVKEVEDSHEFLCFARKIDGIWNLDLNRLSKPRFFPTNSIGKRKTIVVVVKKVALVLHHEPL
mmetsp:Transcript_23162/g.48983  ORF Transcript_23162/g.48983 Transcript_23162/m.48983 type:complete len:96 (-) Transcript_23162:47-334(-)